MNQLTLDQRTDKWLADNGINIKHIYAGTTELFETQKLATTTLKQHGKLLQHNQAATLNAFLKVAGMKNTRSKITQGQCYKVMNIAKQAQRFYSKINKKK